MNALVLGGGAVGSVMAGFLAREGRDVKIVDPWFHHVERIKGHGLRVETVEEDFTCEVPAFHLDELERLGKPDLIFIATKSYDTSWMARLAREHLADHTSVLSAQNGMNDRAIGAVLGDAHMVGCVVVMACELVDPGHAKRTSESGYVSLIVGEFGEKSVSSRSKEIAEFLAPLGSVEVVPDIWDERWGKLTLNAMSNGLAGLTAHTTKELWSAPTVIDVLIGLGREVALVARARGIHMAPVLQKIPHDQLLRATGMGTPEWGLIRESLIGVAETRTGKRENTPSLLQDIKKGRRTEIDYINGWVAAEAEAVGIDAPLNRAVVKEIRTVERGERAPSPANIAPLAELVAKFYA